MPTKGSLSNICDPSDGDRQAVLFDCFNPPTLNHARAAEVLFLKFGTPVILCPLPGGDEHVQAMVSILCADLSSVKVKAWSVSSKNINTPKDALAWLGKTRKGIILVPACISPAVLDVGRKFIQVVFGGGKPSKNAEGIAINNILAVPDRIVERIKSGGDESRNIPLPVWAYIQRKKLYR